MIAIASSYFQPIPPFFNCLSKFNHTPPLVFCIPEQVIQLELKMGFRK